MEIKDSNDVVMMLIDRLDEINNLRPWSKKLVIQSFMNLYNDVLMAQRYGDPSWNSYMEMNSRHTRKELFEHHIELANSCLGSIERIMAFDRNLEEPE